jgi:uncharacterized membrane protein required for colicin V production
MSMNLSIILAGNEEAMIAIDENWILYINIAAAVIFILCLIKGWHRGLLRMLISLGGTLLSLYGAWVFSETLQDQISLWPEAWMPRGVELLHDMIYPLLNRVAWFFLLFIGLKICFWILDKIFIGLQRIPVLKQINEILGTVLGACEAVIWCMVLSLILCTPLFSNGAAAVDQSVLGAIQNTNNAVVNTALKPLYETEDLLKLITDFNEVAKEQNLIGNFLPSQSTAGSAK